MCWSSPGVARASARIWGRGAARLIRRALLLRVLRCDAALLLLLLLRLQLHGQLQVCC
jgi:hypothetical protein